MARINIDDSLFTDLRFEIIVSKIGIDVAVGQFVRIVKSAQKYWLDGKQKIPENIYKLGEFSSYFIDSGMVIKHDDGLYLSGSEEQFAWIVSRRENGQKGGRPKKNNNLEKPNDNLNKPLGSGRLSTDNPLTLTLPLAPTLPLRNKNKNILSSKLDDAREVLEYLNQKTGKDFKLTTISHLNFINSRLKEGYSKEDCKRVIDCKCDAWLEDLERNIYLRPSTLFRPSNFDGYLNEKNTKSIDEIQKQDRQKTDDYLDRLEGEL